MAATNQRRGRAWQSVDITVKLLTGKVLSFNQIPLNTTIKELKLRVEDASGIPSQCQRLTYLDMCDMFDHKTLEQSDVVDKGRLNLKVWAPFGNLVNAASAGHITQVFQAGLITKWGQINKDEAPIALYIASHCGHIRLALMLLSYGVDVNSTTKLGRTALHAAGIKGQWSILCLLINWGANIYHKDNSGNTAMDYARSFGHRESARGLALYEWHLNKEQRALRKHNPTEEEKNIDVMAQFPSHWITQIPGAKVQQILQPPVTMNLVAARAANMLVILPELTGNQKNTDPTVRPPSPSYTCGKDHEIPGVIALNVTKTKRAPLPPITRQRSAVPNFTEWLETKSREETELKKELKRAKEEEERKEKEAALLKQVKANQAFEDWMRNRTKSSVWASTNRLSATKVRMEAV